MQCASFQRGWLQCMVLLRYFHGRVWRSGTQSSATANSSSVTFTSGRRDEDLFDCLTLPGVCPTNTLISSPRFGQNAKMHCKLNSRQNKLNLKWGKAGFVTKLLHCRQLSTCDRTWLAPKRTVVCMHGVPNRLIASTAYR